MQICRYLDIQSLVLDSRFQSLCPVLGLESLSTFLSFSAFCFRSLFWTILWCAVVIWQQHIACFYAFAGDYLPKAFCCCPWVNDHILKVCQHDILTKCLCEFHQIYNFDAVGDRYDLSIFKGQKIKIMTRQNVVKNHLFNSAHFQRKLTGWQRSSTLCRGHCFVGNLMVKDFWKLVKIWRIYRHKRVAHFFETRCSSV